MRKKQSQKPGIASLVNLALQLHEDKESEDIELRRRDREIGLRIVDFKHHPGQQIVAWLQSLQAESKKRSTGSSVARIYTLVLALVVLLGLLLGWSLAAAVFWYDGTDPVNVINALAILVGTQVLLLLLLVIALLLPKVARNNLTYSLRDTLSLLSPGNLIRLGKHFLPRSFHEKYRALAGKGYIHHRLFSRVHRWGITFAAQSFAVAFNIGILVSCLYLVIFSDLAFSWNTTLDISAGKMHSITSLLSTPWSGWLQVATPSQELIEATRYYRLKEGVLPNLSPSFAPANLELLGQWWPFLMACIIVYGLLPRVVLLTVSVLLFRRTITKTMLHLPGVPELLDRLNSRLIETPSSSVIHLAETEDRHITVSWAGANTPEGIEAYQVGGINTLDEDRKIIGEIAALDEEKPLWIYVKAWEPPVTEFIDFLSDLREQLAEKRSIVICLSGLSEKDRANPEEIDVWQARITAIGDPWLSVITTSKHIPHD